MSDKKVLNGKCGKEASLKRWRNGVSLSCQRRDYKRTMVLYSSKFSDSEALDEFCRYCSGDEDE